MSKILALTAFALLSVAADSASAYVGPGAGITAFGSVVALVATFALVIVGFVWYPIKRLRKRLNPKAEVPRDPGHPEGSDA